MSGRNWRTANPASFEDAMVLCLDYAQEKHRRNVQRVAALHVPSQNTIHGYLRGGSIPGRKLEAFQHACGCDFLTRYLAHSAGNLLIPIPTGKRVGVDDVHRLQGTLNDAVRALLGFAAGTLDADGVNAAMTSAMEALAWQRENAARNDQPELELRHD